MIELHAAATRQRAFNSNTQHVDVVMS